MTKKEAVERGIKLWLGLAKIVENIMSKLFLFLVFFLIVTPVAGVRRLLGKDSLHLRDFAKKNNSVWMERSHCYTKDDLEKQF